MLCLEELLTKMSSDYKVESKGTQRNAKRGEIKRSLLSRSLSLAISFGFVAFQVPSIKWGQTTRFRIVRFYTIIISLPVFFTPDQYI